MFLLQADNQFASDSSGLKACPNTVKTDRFLRKKAPAGHPLLATA